jgi:chemotaxis response regulator CheB
MLMFRLAKARTPLYNRSLRHRARRHFYGFLGWCDQRGTLFMPPKKTTDTLPSHRRKSSTFTKRIAAKTPGKARLPYIVGMGGSAGSLEAFGQFFAHMPSDSGLAFVLIPHLDPSHKGIMPELIQRSTKMTVRQAEDGLKVRANSIYIIPPNKDMSLLHSTLYLHEPTAARGWRTPIDFFFRHLAKTKAKRRWR